MENIYKKESTELKQFQKKGVVKILQSKSLILGDATGLGKTLQILTAFTYYKTKYPLAKLIILTDKSIVKQFNSEVYKFFDGLTTILSYELDKEQRFKVYKEFFESKDVLITNYGSIRSDVIDPESLNVSLSFTKKPVLKKELTLKGSLGTLKVNSKGNIRYALTTDLTKQTLKKTINGTDTFTFKDSEEKQFKIQANVTYEEQQIYCFLTNLDPQDSSVLNTSETYYTSPFPKWLNESININKVPYIMAFDEAEAFQDADSITYKMGSYLSKRGSKVIGITATVSKGEFLEAYNIFKCIGIKLTKTKEDFKDKFCVYEPNYKLPKVKWGARKGKPQLEHVGYKNASSFQQLISPYYIGRSKKDVASEIPAFTHKRYYPEECEGIKQALSKLYYDSMVTKVPVNIGRLRIAYMSPQLIDETLPSDYITSPVQDFIHACNHKFVNEKIVVYLDYKSPIDVLQAILPKHMPKTYKNILKITGDIGNRQEVIDQFRDSPDHNILFLNSAGRRGLNLQFSGDLWFMIDPFTGGDYSQVGGRLSRIGTNQTSLTIHKSIIKDSVLEDVQYILQADLRVMQRIAPNTVDAGLIEPEYDTQCDIPDMEQFLLKSFQNRKSKYILEATEI